MNSIILGGFGLAALIVAYLKRDLILDKLKERLEFAKQVNSIKNEAYKKEKLRLAAEEGRRKARGLGFSTGKLIGINTRSNIPEPPEPPDHLKSKVRRREDKKEKDSGEINMEDEFKKIRELMGIRPN